MALIRLTRTASGLTATGDFELARRAGYGEGDTAVWTFRDGAFRLAADRLGLVPLFNASTSDGLLCADNIAELLRAGVPCRLDRTAVALSHGLGFCPGAITVFEGISRLGPSATLHMSAAETAIGGALRPPGPSGISRTAALDAYGELLEASLRRLAGEAGRVSVPLSGGRDSRHILFAARAAGLEIEAATFKNFPPTGKDVAVAAGLCRRLGCPHTILENTEYDYHRSLVRALPEIDFELLEHGWIWSLVSHFAKTRRAFADGLGGDVLSNGLYFSLADNRHLRGGDLAAAGASFEKSALTHSRVAHLLSAHEKERVRSIIREEMAHWRDWPNPLIAFVMFNRTRRGAACAPLAISRLAGVRALFPYLERSVFDFLIGLDGEFFAEPGFHDEAIARRYPAYADIPFGKGRPAPLGYAASARNALAYLAPTPKIEGLAASGRARLVGILRILAGGDFFAESWRFQDFDLAAAISRALRHADP